MTNEQEQKIEEMQEELKSNKDFSYTTSTGERIQAALARNEKIAEENPYALSYTLDIQYLTELYTLNTMLIATIADNLKVLTQLVTGINSGVTNED